VLPNVLFSGNWRAFGIAHRMTMSIAELRAAGMTFEADEAIAIAQQLIASLREPRGADEVRAPYGPPSAQNVFLNEDGSVSCRGCMTTPAVSEVGIFLDELLPAGSPRVPGAVRYTIARSLLDVDVPPFDSLDEFSQDLARHERGNRAAIVRRVLARARGQRAIVPMALVERRRGRASASALRRELREADLRLFQQRFQQREGRNAMPAVLDLAAQAPVPQRSRTPIATAACLAAGLSLIVAGELMHVRHAPIAAPQATPQVIQASPAAPLDAQRTATSEARVDHERIVVAPDRGIIAVRHVSSSPVPTSHADARRTSVKRAPRPAVVNLRRRAQSRPPSRGVLDRLRLGWLRNAFTSL
jgi:hypothetical protein